MPRTKDYSIRVGTLEDIFEMTLLAREAYEGLPDKKYYTFSSKKVGVLLQNTLEKDTFLILVLLRGEEIVGYFFGMVADCFFALEKQATSLSWFIRPEHRSIRNAFSLLKQYEEWAVSKGVVSINMVNLKTSSPKLFEKLGYEITETTLVKRVR